MRRATLRSLLLATALLGAGAVQAAEFDLVILGGQVVDGTGKPAYRADLAVEGDRIVRIARDGLKPADGEAVLAAAQSASVMRKR